MLAGLVLVFFVTVVPWFFTHIITTSRFHFPDPNDGKTPKSYGLEFHKVQFRSTDGILLRGWYIAAGAEARGTIIYVHGHNRTRVEMLPEVAFAHGLSYNGLLFDLRHEGQSEGELTSVGYFERRDVLGAVDYALKEESARHPVILWGVSMGAAAALMAAADSTDVDAVISDSTFLSFKDVVRHHWKLFFGLPSFPVADEVIYWSAWKADFRPSDFDVGKAVQRIGNRPILFIAVEGDRRMPPSIARALFAISASPQKMLVVLPGNRHGEGFRLSADKYKDAVAQFLGRLSRPAIVKEVRYGNAPRN